MVIIKEEQHGVSVMRNRFKKCRKFKVSSFNEAKIYFLGLMALSEKECIFVTLQTLVAFSASKHCAFLYGYLRNHCGLVPAYSVMYIIGKCPL